MGEIYKNLPLEMGYNAIIIDPPWKYNDLIDDVRGAEKHYQTLEIEDIAKFPIKKYCHKNTFIYMWTTKDFRMLAEIMLKNWGFSFKTEFIWVKIKNDGITFNDVLIGMGHYNRLCHEYLLFATSEMCDIYPLNHKFEKSVFFAPRAEHSEKPKVSYEIIERNCRPPYLEIFARKQRKNWTSWGNEVSPCDVIDSTNNIFEFF